MSFQEKANLHNTKLINDIKYSFINKMLQGIDSEAMEQSNFDSLFKLSEIVALEEVRVV